MAVIEETRKLIQDFLAPGLREVKATLNDLGGRFDRLERRMADDKAEILRHMDRRFDDMMEMVRVRERFAVVEAKQKELAGS